jgi:hypothetical protein
MPNLSSILALSLQMVIVIVTLRLTNAMQALSSIILSSLQIVMVFQWTNHRRRIIINLRLTIVHENEWTLRVHG